MLRHTVLFRLTPDATAEQRQAALAALRALPGQIPEIREYHVGTDAGLREGNYDVGVIALFDDEAGWRAYQDHPAHVAVVVDHIRPITAERASVQFPV